MNFQVNILWRTVEDAWATIEVEADSARQAERNVYEQILNGKLDPEWSKPEIVDGAFEVTQVMETNLT